jgi:hypothetical protein
LTISAVETASTLSIFSTVGDPTVAPVSLLVAETGSSPFDADDFDIVGPPGARPAAALFILSLYALKLSFFLTGLGFVATTPLTAGGAKGLGSPDIPKGDWANGLVAEDGVVAACIAEGPKLGTGGNCTLNSGDLLVVGLVAEA